MNAPAYLTDEEIATICRPYRQRAAQLRYLRSLGLAVRPRPDGSPLVARSHFEQVMGAMDRPAANGPRWSK